MLNLRKQIPKKRFIISMSALVLIGVGLIVGIILFKQSQKSASPETTVEQSDDSISTQDNLVPKPTINDPGAEQKGVEGINTTNESAGAAAFPTTQPNLSISITDAKQKGSQLFITTQVSPSVKGTCVFDLTQPNGTTQSRTVEIDGQKCPDTTLPLAASIPGEWTLTAKVTVGDNVATATRAIMIQNY